MILFLKLPANLQIKLTFSPTLTVHNLKNSIEKLYGVPCELQRLQYSGKVLEGEKILGKAGVIDGAVISVGVNEKWLELISMSLQGNTKMVQQLLSVTQQNEKNDNRTFVALFICATKCYPSCIANILSVNKEFDLKATTRVTGRTVLHAAITSGSLKCVEAIKKFAGMKFEQLLYVEDRTGCSPLACLSCSNLRMLNYINKFISTPLSIQDVEKFCANVTNPITTVEGEEVNSIEKENTYVIETDQKVETKDNILINKNQMNNIKNADKALQQKSTNTCTPGEANTHVFGLSRRKEENHVNSNITKLNAPVQTEEIQTVSPLLIEKTENTTIIKIGEARSINTTPEKLPSLNASNEKQTDSKILQPTNKTREATLPATFPRQPRPPTQDKKRRAVAGMLMESSARKFSTARANRGSSEGNVNVPKQLLATRRPASAESAKPLHHSKPDNDRNATTTKVRRISLIQSPQKSLTSSDNQQAGNGNDKVNLPETKVFEIEKDRINKPWNSWIKAVSVDADSAEAKQIITNPPKIEQTKSRKSSLQVQNGGNNRKQSFDQWVLHKTQEQMDELLKLREENKHKEANEVETKCKHGKTFEDWKREKEEYDRLLKEQQREDEKENRVPRKFLKGKTFEQWQKETEERERLEIDMKKSQQVKEKVEKESKQVKRRKESVAKYQKWLLEKQEQELQELEHAFTKRKNSTTVLSETKNRKRSVNLNSRNA